MRFRTEVRVRYHETDAMGVAHHSSHLVWFEIGRTELMRARGISYAELEKEKRERVRLGRELEELRTQFHTMNVFMNRLMEKNPDLLEILAT